MESDKFDPFERYHPVPLGKNVIIEKQQQGEQAWRPGAKVLMPQQAATQSGAPTLGTVRFSGEEVTKVSVGDIVMFPRFSGNAVGTNDFILMSEEHIQCRMTPKT